MSGKIMSRIQPERVTDTHAFFWNSLYSQWYTRKNLFEENGKDRLWLK